MLISFGASANSMYLVLEKSALFFLDYFICFIVPDDYLKGLGFSPCLLSFFSPDS